MISMDDSEMRPNERSQPAPSGGRVSAAGEASGLSERLGGYPCSNTLDATTATRIAKPAQRRSLATWVRRGVLGVSCATWTV